MSGVTVPCFAIYIYGKDQSLFNTFLYNFPNEEALPIPSVKLVSVGNFFFHPLAIILLSL